MKLRTVEGDGDKSKLQRLLNLAETLFPKSKRLRTIDADRSNETPDASLHVQSPQEATDKL